MTGITFGTWTWPGETVEAVDWLITANPFDGLPMYSGTAAPANALQFINPNGYDINNSSFSVPSLALGAGTYWLQLENAVTPGGPAYWDQNNGPSAAFHSLAGSVPSQSFQILGDASGVPEPNSLALGGSGFLLLAAGALRRKLKG